MIRLVILWISILPALANIIPANRLYPWSTNTVGIPGGVPVLTTMFCNVLVSIPGTNIVAVGNGIHDDGPALAAALRNCPSNQYIYLPPGTYSNSVNLTVGSGKVIRGAGNDATGTNWLTEIVGGQITIDANPGLRRFLPMAGGSSAVCASGATSITIQTNSLTPSTSLTILPRVGSIITIAVTNDLVLIDPQGFEGSQADVDVQLADKNQAEMHEVTAMSTVGSNIVLTLSPPVGWSYSNSLGVVVRIAEVTYRAGVEDLWLDSPTKLVPSRFKISNAAFCWLRNVKTTWSYNDAVYLQRGFRCEVRDSWFESTRYTTPGGGYGTRLDLTPSFCLVENNVYNGVRASIILSGGFGSVVSGNFVAWQTNYNNVNQKAIGIHACSPSFFLIEGNKAGQIGSDDVHGSSMYSTMLRNNSWAYNVRGNATTGASEAYNWAAIHERKNLNYNWVGNVLGYPSMTGTNEASYLFNGGHRSAHAGYIWSLGYINGGAGNTNCQTGAGGFTYCYDPNTVTTLLRVKNWNYLLNSVETYTNNASSTTDPIPDSMLYTSKPSWYGTNIWPSIGPDLSNMTNAIPAETRYNGGGVIPPYVPGGPGLIITGRVQFSGVVNLKAE